MRNPSVKKHILGLYTTIYHVKDIAHAKAWYASLLGQEPYFDEPFYVGFNVAGHELGLLPKSDEAKSSATVVAYWGVASISDACATLAEKQHVLFEPITDVGGGIKVATFRDLDGNIVGLIENPHFQNTCESTGK